MIGNKVKLLRKSKGLTQLEFAKQVGISRSIIGMLETNKQGTSQINTKKIADFFNVSIDYLLSNIENNLEISTLEKQIDLHQIKLLKEFKKLNLKGKEEAVKRIKELSELNKYQDTEFATELIPIAAHEKEGDFTKEEYQHDIDLMKNDDLWK